jgi:hypothetical protein
MNNLATQIAQKLHMLRDKKAFKITDTNLDGKVKTLAIVTHADFVAVSAGNSLEDILSCDGDVDWVAYRLSQRCKCD